MRRGRRLTVRVAVFAVGLSVVTTILAGPAPALHASSTEVVSALKVVAWEAFRRNRQGSPSRVRLPRTPHSSNEHSMLLIGWGLIFVLHAEEQRRFIQGIADLLVPDGRLLFTSEAEPLEWSDAGPT